MEYNLIHNKAETRYEIHVDGYLAYLQYDIKGSEIYLTHTIVAPELGGRGIGTVLVKLALADIEKQGLTVVPICSFVVHYLSKYAGSKLEEKPDIVSEDVDLNEFIKSDKPTIVEFALKGCGTCRMQASVLDQVSEQYGDKVSIQIETVGVGTELEKQFALKAAPTLIMYNNKEQVWRKNGFSGLDAIKVELDKLV